MSTNGYTSPRNSTSSDPKSPQNSSPGFRASLDSEGSSSPRALNGNGLRHDNEHAEEENVEELDPVLKLQRELGRTNEEKEQLATQYRNLLAKLTTMRTTLGAKLKQDAVRNQAYWSDNIANLCLLA